MDAHAYTNKHVCLYVCIDLCTQTNIHTHKQVLATLDLNLDLRCSTSRNVRPCCVNTILHKLCHVDPSSSPNTCVVNLSGSVVLSSYGCTGTTCQKHGCLKLCHGSEMWDASLEVWNRD